MKPATPVVPGQDWEETVYAKDQDEYQNLPAIVTTDGIVITRWRLDWRERLRALWFGDVYLRIWTFRQPLQPVLLEVKPPQLGASPGESPRKAPPAALKAFG